MADDLVRQIDARIAFVDAQTAAGTPRSSLQAHAANTLELIFKHSKGLQLDDITMLTRKVNSGPWLSSERLKLAQALSDTLGANDVALSLGCRGNDVCQTCDEPEMFLTDSQWDALMSDQLSANAKVKVLARAWYGIGLDCPSEQTLKRGGCILLWSHYRTRQSPPKPSASCAGPCRQRSSSLIKGMVGTSTAA